MIEKFIANAEDIENTLLLISTIIGSSYVLYQIYLKHRELKVKRLEIIKEISNANKKLYTESVFAVSYGIIFPFNAIRALQDSDYPIKSVELARSGFDFLEWNDQEKRFESSRKISLKVISYILFFFLLLIIIVFGFSLVFLFATQSLIAAGFCLFLAGVVYLFSLEVIRPLNARTLIQTQGQLLRPKTKSRSKSKPASTHTE